MSWRSKYIYIYEFQNGFAIVIKRINNKLKWGFVNTEGKEVVPLIYDDITCFINGFAKVSKISNGKLKWGVVNTKGKEIIPCVYDIEYAKQLLNDYKKKKLLEKFLEV